MWQYSDYLAVSKEFIPVFSAEVDKNHRGNWKSFIPHNAMYDILQKLIKALERSSTGDNRSLWLTGAYGTGKTFASFVLKHLLEDDISEIEDYFKKHQIITPLWLRFKALRERNRYLVIYRSSSAHITSSRRLLVEIQEAVKEQLRAQNLKSAFSRGILDAVLEKLSGGFFNWEWAFDKYRSRFMTVNDAWEVMERLRTGDMVMGEKVAQIMEEEGISLADTPDDVKAWIKEVIAGNDLQGIIFIWDEFTEFFANNVPVTSLQELAQAAAGMPFYMLLVTHRALNQFARIDEDTRQKLLDRFHNCQLEMSPVTAYRLIGNVIEAHPGTKKEWENRRDSLWGQVNRIMVYINLLGESVRKEEIKSLAPIHPFTAYLLATISSLYSSSQRTLFQFLKTEEPSSFQWFINNYPRNAWYWLTPDFLWEYFFENTKIEAADSINDVLTYYNTVKSSLASEDELPVFRVMLLLTALWRQTGGTNKLLKPSLSILQRMFLGTELNQRMPQIADGLCSKGIMHPLALGSDCEYIIPTMTIDQEKLKREREWVEKNLSFEKMINPDGQTAHYAFDLQNLIPLQGAGEKRHPVQMISAKELKQRGERAVQDVERAFEIAVVMVLAQEDEHLIDTEQKASEISRELTSHVIIIAQSSFGKKRWQEWMECRAKGRYAEDVRDTNNKRVYENKAVTMNTDWIREIKTGRFRAFFRGKQAELAGSDAIADYLDEICMLVFPYGPENLSKVRTLYTSAWGKTGAEIGLKVASAVSRPYKDVVDELKSQGLWEDSRILYDRPDHPLGRMKLKITSVIKESSSFNLKSLWEGMEEPPFGLMPSPIGILLFAFLLRDYASGYYYSDGMSSYPLNPNKLAEIIDAVMKSARLSENYSIRKMSDAAEKFCQMIREIFNLDLEKASYPEEARKNIRAFISQVGYPLWALNHYVFREHGDSSFKNSICGAIEAIEDMLDLNQDAMDDRKLEEVYVRVKPAQRDLTMLINRRNLQEGLKLFCFSQEERLEALLKTLNLDVSQVTAKLKGLLNEEVWLWQQERVKEKLPDVVLELDLVEALNQLSGTAAKNINEARHYFRTGRLKSKFPFFIYRVNQPPYIAELVDFLHNLVNHPDINIRQFKFYPDQIRNHLGELRTLLKDEFKLLARLTVKYCGTELADSDIEALYQALPDLSGASDESYVKEAIINALRAQSKQKRIKDFKNLWRDLTGTRSPFDWSEKKRIPVQWVLEGNSHHTFLQKAGAVERLSNQEIEEIIRYVETNKDEIAVLNNDSFVKTQFIKVAAGDYAGLVEQTGMVADLQDFIYQSLKGNVYNWPLRLGEINRLVRDWVGKHYKKTAYQKVVKIIDDFPAADIKEFVKQLAEDAVVGARLLQHVGREKAFSRR
ncbi:MAG TPA: hypothetical protein PK728_11345 [Bacillota bacterium]|nr:hypothetical protein [Bacillota bacterium]